MEQYKLELSEQGCENIEETIATLMEAAQEIAKSSEEDFEHIKSKKWYKRLWELVTYSKDNQKVTAKGVQNLAKLTEIVMKAIVILARYNADTAALVLESLKKIENLNQHLGNSTAGLNKVAVEVEKLKYNYKKSLSIKDLNKQERDIVGSIFSKYVSHCRDNKILSNEASRKLYSSVMKGDIPENDIDISTHLDKLNVGAQQLLYRLNQSYYYLITDRFDESEYFDVFDISNKNMEIIKQQIADIVQFSGPENYADTLTCDDTVNYVDLDGVETDELISEESADTQQANDGEPESDNIRIGSSIDPDKEKLEDYIVSEMLHIQNGEVKEFVSKKLHINSIVNCEGRIEFNNCIVYYNDSDHTSKVKLGDSATLEAKNCIFVCENKDTRHFISAEPKAASVKFENCDFRDCSYFLNCYLDVFQLNNCKLLNCACGFIETGAHDDGIHYIIKNNVIESKALTLFNTNEKKYEPLFKLYGKGSITNNRIEGSEHLIDIGERYKGKYFIADECTMSQCEFYNASYCTDAHNISKCVFKNCNTPVYHYPSFIDECEFEDCTDAILISSEKSQIKNCKFEDCTNAICIHFGKSQIKNCKFVSCKNRLINASQADIEFCEFRNCEFLNYNIIFNKAAIFIENFTRVLSSTIKNCIFDGCNAGEGFLIKSDVHKKSKGSVLFVEDCDFKNCTTKRKDNKIIDVMSSYLSAFNNLKFVKTVCVSNSRGLDKVNKGG